MVSRIASTTRVKITSRRDSWALDVSPGEVLEGLTIRWGRDSLRSSPRNRTASLSIRAPRGRKPGELFWASVEIWISGTLVFGGTIDAIETKDKSSDLFWRINAVEAPTMLKHLVKNVRVDRCERPGQIWQKVQSSGGNPQEIEIIGLDFSASAPHLANETVTSKRMQFKFWDVWSALAAVWPASFAAWRPGFKKVGTTVWKFGNYYRNEVNARAVTFSHAKFALSDMILAFDITTGGLYGERAAVDAIRHRTDITEAIRLNGKTQRPWNMSQNWDFPIAQFNQPIALLSWKPGDPWEPAERAAAFLLCQPTAPLTMTVHDRDDLPSVPAAVWRTWEEQQVLSITGTRKTPTGIEASWLSDRVAIGGTLRVAPGESRHELITVQGRDARF